MRFSKKAAGKSKGKTGSRSGTSNAPEILPEIELAPDSKIIKIIVKAKEGKKTLYNCKITINNNESESSQSQVLKELEIEIKGIKHNAYIQATEKAFQVLLKDFPESKGIPVKLQIDKTFIKTLKKAYQIADSIEEEFKKALKEQHDAKIKELQELQQTVNILSYFQTFPFVFDPV